MDWIKLHTGYYLDGALLRAGEAAELLWIRAKAYAGKEETDGLIPREALPLITPTRGPARAAALVREGLWVVVPRVGWQFVVWDQRLKVDLEADREAARSRQARSRTTKRGRHAVTPPVTPPVTHGASHGEVTPTEVEVEVEVEAAAAAAAAAGVPVAVEILRSKLQAVTALASLRFDQLTPHQVDHLAALVGLHGDQRLVDVAIRTLRHPAPTSVAAFLGTWAALPPPGHHVAVVRQRCPTHDTQLTSAGVCSSCAADQLEEGSAR